MNYEQPWDLDPSNILSLSAEVHGDFHATVSSPGQEVSLWLEANDETTLKRFFACWLIATMPVKAIDEALQSLKDIHEFYRYVPATLSVERKQEKLEGRLTAKRQRPGLIIGE